MSNIDNVQGYKKMQSYWLHCFVPVRFRNYIDVRDLLLELEQLLDLRRRVSIRPVIGQWFRWLLWLRLRSRSPLLHSSWRGSRNRRRGRVLRFRLSLRTCLTIVWPPVHPVTFWRTFVSSQFDIYSETKWPNSWNKWQYRWDRRIGALFHWPD